ncbi:sigma 54-interacting transcriptional regulator, partial [Gemmatimonas aurantiaca]|nr:sigma 54-interacting transcriptional regulator [Gemmatimonas aurantiaca]
TLFLDEIGEMPQSLQMRLLNVIEEKRFRPLGSTVEIQVDFILITATNCNLKEMVDNREFRRDLYHRLDGFTFEIPPLRERKEDIPLMLEYYMARYGLLDERSSVEPELVRRFLAYDWPGNVRELENKVKRMKAMSALVQEGSLVELISGVFDNEQAIENADLFSRMERFERELIVEALISENWNKSAAARLLDVHEATLRAKMRRLDISIPDENGKSDERRVG